MTDTDEDAHLTDIRAVGALCLVLGTFGMVSLPLSGIRFHDGSPVGQIEVGLYQGLVDRTSIDALWMLIGSLLWTGLCTGLMIAAIGCLLLKWWARPALLAWATAALGLAAASSFFYFRWLLPPWRDHLSEVRGEVDSLLMIAVWAVSAALGVMVLVALNRRPVRQYFRQLRRAAEKA